MSSVTVSQNIQANQIPACRFGKGRAFTVGGHLKFVDLQCLDFRAQQVLDQCYEKSVCFVFFPFINIFSMRYSIIAQLLHKAT